MALAVCSSIQISYDDTGPVSTRTPVVFLHAHSLGRSMWDHQKQAIRSTHRVVTYDLRGHGSSEKPKTGYSREEEISDLAGLLDVIKAQKAHLVGLSRGGSIALGFAAAHPERTASVVAMGAGFDYPRHIPELADQILQTMATLRAEGLRAAREYWSSIPLFAPARENEELASALEQMILAYTGTHWLDPSPPQDPSLADAAPSITAPALILVGERDLPGFHAWADELAEKIPAAEKKVIAGAGHLVSLEAPEEATAAISEFLAKNPA
ncbi:MAG: alpha/beta fold hydrolase [bacterium]